MALGKNNETGQILAGVVAVAITIFALLLGIITLIYQSGILSY